MRHLLNYLKICFIIIIIVSFIFHPIIINRLTQWYLRLKNYISNDNTLPNSESSLNYEVTFHLWTRYNNKNAEKLVVQSEDTLAQTHYVSGKTYLIIPGFSQHGLASWIITMKNALLHREDCNVISVDWQSGTISGEYFIIQGRVPEVGEDVAHLIKFLHEVADQQLTDVNIIGHSLGAHVAGFASKSFDGKIGRISALDPASYGYRNVATSLRLDKTDARLVDVMHTNACSKVSSTFLDCYGLDENIGHVDFWPNGGDHQPPCRDLDSNKHITEISSSCDHSIGIYYYIESIRSSFIFPKFLSRACESWEHYKNGSCSLSIKQQLMGYHTRKSIHGVFYLHTHTSSPFSVIDIFQLVVYLLKHLVSTTVIMLLLLVIMWLTTKYCNIKLHSLVGLLETSLLELFSISHEVEKDADNLRFTQY